MKPLLKPYEIVFEKGPYFPKIILLAVNLPLNLPRFTFRKFAHFGNNIFFCSDWT